MCSCLFWLLRAPRGWVPLGRGGARGGITDHAPAGCGTSPSSCPSGFPQSRKKAHPLPFSPEHGFFSSPSHLNLRQEGYLCAHGWASLVKSVQHERRLCGYRCSCMLFGYGEICGFVMCLDGAKRSLSRPMFLRAFDFCAPPTIVGVNGKRSRKVVPCGCYKNTLNIESGARAVHCAFVAEFRTVGFLICGWCIFQPGPYLNHASDIRGPPL